MAAPSPSLSLSDIMHPFSPPPTAKSPPLPRPRSITPEPLEPADIEEMRRKVLAMGWGDSSKGKEKVGSREQELIDMLLRLTHPASLPQPSQLHAQAETIANLIQQRDFLVTRSVEERERWDSEKESWARAAQALIVQGRKEAAKTEKEEAVAAQYALVTADASTQRMQEFERANAVLQNDKKALQQKLTDTQFRLASLESELAQLKPLLLMQPFALTHSHPTGTARGWSAVLPSTSSAAATRREKERRLDEEVDDEPESDEDQQQQQQQQQQQPAPLQPRPQFRNPILRPAGHEPPPPTSPYKPKGDYYRRRDVPAPLLHYPSAQYVKPIKRKVGAQSSPGKSVLSDARAEHLLLAARKIGRQRASILSGAFAHVQQLSEPSSYYKQKPPSTPQPPKTPRRNASNAATTPLLTRTPLGQAASGSALPRTPLQSLLSAAQSVLSAPGEGTSPPTTESPVAKRRKLDPAITVIKSAATPPTVRKEKDKEKGALPGGVARVRSALDFLADQAEVYSTQPASQDSVESESSQAGDVEMGDAADPDGTTGLDKGKEKEQPTESESISRAATPGEREIQPPRADGDQLTLLQTHTTRKGRDATPKLPSLSPSHTEPVQTNSETNPRSSLSSTAATETAGAPAPNLTLAPAIDLTPRASRSPVPQATLIDPHPNPHKRSRSSSAERQLPRALSAPATDTPSGSFSMFSLERPQPVAPTPGGVPSVLLPTPGGQTLEQGPGHDSNEGATSKVVEGVKFVSDTLPRRTRSPYIKWTKEEDELLAKAVAKYGTKWDLVQKALPSRGYHQVRQRWLRKLGVFDGNKLDLSSLETNAAAEFLNLSTAPPADDDGVLLSESRPTANPKLGLAPLNSERALTGSSSSSADAVGSLSPFSTGGQASGFPFPSEVSAVHAGRSSSWPAGGHGDGG